MQRKMKIRLSHILSLLLCIMLIAAAVCIGAYRGWSAERESALTFLTTGGELQSLLENRALDAGNLAIVAARHLPADNADLLSLRSASTLLLSGSSDALAIIDADRTITDVALRFARELPALTSMQHSQRDTAYVRRFGDVLGQPSNVSQAYASQVDDFNQRLTSSLMGRLSMLLGVRPLSAITEP